MKRLGLLLALLTLVAAAIAYAQTPPPVPALPDSPRLTSYSLSASTCACSVGFALYADGTDVDNWIDVFINGVSVPSTSSTAGWTLTSPTGSLGSIPRPITNAVLTFNAPQTGTINIVGNRRPRRLSQFQEGRGFTARDINQVITDEIAMLRETWDRLNGAIVGQPGEVLNPLPPSGTRAGKLLVFDSGGQPIVSTLQTSIPPGIPAVNLPCYQANGFSHPLSSVTSCNGINTTGFTLAQWQSILPAATSLTDEVDWASLQSTINAAMGPLAIRLPPGVAMLNKALSICNQSVAFFGSGGNSATTATTLLNFTGGTDGIDHCGGSATSVELQDIGLNSTTTTGSLYGVNDAAANYTYLRNVLINGFRNGILFNNPGGTRLLSVWLHNGQAAGADTSSTGVTFTGRGFVNHISDTLAQGYAISYHFTSTPISSMGLEDIHVINSACGGTWKCIIIDSTDPTYGPFNYSFTNMSVDAAGSFLFAPECNNVLVTGGDWLADTAVGSWTSGQNLFDLGTGTSGCHMVRLRDLWFGNSTVVAPNSFASVEATSNDVIFSGIHLETVNVSMVSGWYQVANGATNVIERDTAWVQFFSPIAPPSNAIISLSSSTTNKLQSFVLGPPTVSACGTSPIVGSGATGEQGTIVMGTGSPTGCTVTFPVPNRAVAPSCILLSRQPSFPVQPITISTSQIVWTNPATSGLFVDYRCTPY
jgi:hypothetical protein